MVAGDTVDRSVAEVDIAGCTVLAVSCTDVSSEGFQQSLVSALRLVQVRRPPAQTHSRPVQLHFCHIDDD